MIPTVFFRGQVPVLPESGQAWGTAALPVADRWRRPEYLNGNLIIFSDSTSKYVVSSSDGTNWTQTTQPIQMSYGAALAYGDGKYVAMRINSATDAALGTSSSDLVNWSPQFTISSEVGRYSDLTYGNGRFVAITNNPTGTGSIAYSDDAGQSWNTVPGPPNQSLEIAFGNGKFVIANLQQGLLYSSDGLSWSSVVGSMSSPGSVSFDSSRGKFIAVQHSNALVQQESEDGVNWNSRSVGGQLPVLGTSIVFTADRGTSIIISNSSVSYLEIVEGFYVEVGNASPASYGVEITPMGIYSATSVASTDLVRYLPSMWTATMSGIVSNIVICNTSDSTLVSIVAEGSVIDVIQAPAGMTVKKLRFPISGPIGCYTKVSGVYAHISGVSNA